MKKEKRMTIQIKESAHQKLKAMALSKKCSIQNVLDNILDGEIKLRKEHLENIRDVLNDLKDLDEKLVKNSELLNNLEGGE